MSQRRRNRTRSACASAHSLPVVDDEETLIGIVTETDFLQVAYQALTAGRPGAGANHAVGAQLR